MVDEEEACSWMWTEWFACVARFRCCCCCKVNTEPEVVWTGRKGAVVVAVVAVNAGRRDRSGLVRAVFVG